MNASAISTKRLDDEKTFVYFLNKTFPYRQQLTLPSLWAIILAEGKDDYKCGSNLETGLVTFFFIWQWIPYEALLKYLFVISLNNEIPMSQLWSQGLLKPLADRKRDIHKCLHLSQSYMYFLHCFSVSISYKIFRVYSQYVAVFQGSFAQNFAIFQGFKETQTLDAIKANSQTFQKGSRNYCKTMYQY